MCRQTNFHHHHIITFRFVLRNFLYIIRVRVFRRSSCRILDWSEFLKVYVFRKSAYSDHCDLLSATPLSHNCTVDGCPLSHFTLSIRRYNFSFVHLPRAGKFRSCNWMVVFERGTIFRDIVQLLWAAENDWAYCTSVCVLCFLLTVECRFSAVNVMQLNKFVCDNDTFRHSLSTPSVPIMKFWWIRWLLWKCFLLVRWDTFDASRLIW